MPDHDPTFSLKEEIRKQVELEDWYVWAVTPTEAPLAPDTTDYARKPALVEIYNFARGCMP